MYDDIKQLNIGGKEPREGWKILNINPEPYVDIVGDCTNLAMFSDNQLSEIYASHVLEHLGYRDELPTALKEIFRVLAPGGRLHVSVPDFEKLCWLMLNPELDANERFFVMRMIFGGQNYPNNIHKVGLTNEFLSYFLRQAGFSSIERVSELGIFDDTSSMRFKGHLISLNIVATKSIA